MEILLSSLQKSKQEIIVSHVIQAGNESHWKGVNVCETWLGDRINNICCCVWILRMKNKKEGQSDRRGSTDTELELMAEIYSST